MMVFEHRPLERRDAEAIATFPQSEEELFFMFPKAQYPLRPESLVAESAHRSDPTVVISEGQVAGYGNFIEAVPGGTCSIGNVVVNPALRQMGVASYLVETLTAIAFDTYGARCVALSCFNENTAGLLLYRKLGFVPVAVDVRVSRQGKQVALIQMEKRDGA